MKYIVMIGDGMADEPCARLEGKTPLAAAQKPYMNYLASMGVNGLVDTVPEGMTPESDTANLAIMGYDPRTYSRGRSPLEALSMGIEMQDDETAIRANLVSLSDEGSTTRPTRFPPSRPPSSSPPCRRRWAGTGAPSTPACPTGTA